MSLFVANDPVVRWWHTETAPRLPRFPVLPTASSRYRASVHGG
ncbi:uncharacterized protein METZ01_LOCUS98871 [marine metagenome]|uniref:Uncharacterized protein n=1 Tax=marine metagenome TaxID=408172 RepID=A0A381W295_9ZZZZ